MKTSLLVRAFLCSLLVASVLCYADLVTCDVGCMAVNAENCNTCGDYNCWVYVRKTASEDTHCTTSKYDRVSAPNGGGSTALDCEEVEPTVTVIAYKCICEEKCNNAVAAHKREMVAPSSTEDCVYIGVLNQKKCVSP